MVEGNSRGLDIMGDKHNEMIRKGSGKRWATYAGIEYSVPTARLYQLSGIRSYPG